MAFTNTIKPNQICTHKGMASKPRPINTNVRISLPSCLNCSVTINNCKMSKYNYGRNIAF